MRTFQKDVDTIAAAAYETATPMPVSGAVQQVLRLAAALGLADADFAAFRRAAAAPEPLKRAKRGTAARRGA
jgi:3-hydroxyisobutyrate dehydrogenase-like beta-hydroxyacid dehydrogenase